MSLEANGKYKFTKKYPFPINRLLQLSVLTTEAGWTEDESD